MDYVSQGVTIELAKRATELKCGLLGKSPLTAPKGMPKVKRRRLASWMGGPGVWQALLISRGVLY